MAAPKPLVSSTELAVTSPFNVGVPVTKIADMKPGMKNLNAIFIALERGSTTNTKEGNTIVQYLVADSSGSILASLWDEKGEALQPGDIFLVKGGRAGTIERIGEYVLSQPVLSIPIESFHLKLAQQDYQLCSSFGPNFDYVILFTLAFSENPNISHFEWVADPKDPSGYTRVEARVGGGSRIAGPPR